MGSQCGFSRRGTEWWWLGANRTSLGAKFWISWRGWMTKLGVPHEETVAIVKSWEDIRSNKSLGCIFSGKHADWTLLRPPSLYISPPLFSGIYTKSGSLLEEGAGKRCSGCVTHPVIWFYSSVVSQGVVARFCLHLNNSPLYNEVNNKESTHKGVD